MAQQEIKDVFGPIASEIRQSLGRGVLTMGESLANAIRTRTKAGIKEGGGNFDPYSERYAKRKGSSNVDLYGNEKVSRPGRSQRMVDSLQVQEGSNGNIKANAAGTGSRLTGAGGRFVKMDQGKDITLTIGVSQENEWLAAEHQEGRHRMPIRPWISVNAQEEQQAFDVLTRELRLPPGTKQIINIKFGL